MSSNIRIKKNCVLCGKLFIAKTLSTKCCGNTCSRRLYKKKKKEEQIEKALLDSSNPIKAPESRLNKRGFLSVTECVNLFGVSESTIRRLIRENLILECL
tara:strand:+ start:1332 stop:1631 length:300 start_codon:yes stop_codon:yes gene_type:complete